MKLYCKLSGVEYEISHQFVRQQAEHNHPIFELSPKTLITYTPIWSSGKMSETESKLFFLALLRATKLVEFRCTATPEPHIVRLNMEKLLRIVNWAVAVGADELTYFDPYSGERVNALPKFVVNYPDRNLSNIYQWIKAWEQAETSWRDNYKKEHIQAKLQYREELLDKLFNSPHTNRTRFLNQLAGWAMEAAQVPVALRPFWTSLFHKTGIDLYNVPAKEYEAIVTYMEEELEVYDKVSYASKVLSHLRQLKARNAASFNFGLGVPDEDTEGGGELPAYTIVEDSVETDNKKRMVALAPVVEPKLDAYPNKLEFLKAKALWQQAQREQDKMVEFEKKQADRLRADELDNIMAAELADEDHDQMDFKKELGL